MKSIERRSKPNKLMNKLKHEKFLFKNIAQFAHNFWFIILQKIAHNLLKTKMHNYGSPAIINN